MMKQSCRKTLQRLVFLITIVFTNLVNAQTLPVQVTPQLIPPHSVKISDYATITNEKLFVNILLTDVNEVGRRVRLKMYIEGQGLSIATLDNVAGAAPIFLDGGINLRLTNLDLQPYFQFNNFTGISPQQYNNPLPNGGYNYCFEVYDYFTGRRISQKSCTTVFLLQNDPPILNLPTRDNIVTATNPQNILFTWTPRHSNLNDVQYEFTLKELWDTQNPQANFLGSIPFYQTTTRSTTLLVGPEAPQLISGKVYGWQVRAFVSDGINETSVFKNNGGSEIFWFKYLEDCRPPSFVLSQALTAESVKIEWQLSDHIKYNIQYRKKGFGDDDWFDVNSYTNEGTIFNLEPDTVYEFRVGGECTPLSGYAYSNIQEFTTPSNDEAAYYNCGITPEINIDNQELLPSLKINETFTAGDFPVTPREVSGSNGTFSGWGYITLPFLENLKEIIDAANILTSGEVNIGKYTRIKVEFENVKINTNKQLIEGVVKTTYDPKWGGILDADEIINDILGDDGNISTYDATNMDIDDVIINDNGDIVIIRDTKNDGPNEEFLDDEIVVVSNLPVVITDQNGDQWTVDEEGNITKGEGAEGGQATSSNTNGVSGSGNVNEISSKDVSVKFIPSGFYGTDEYNTKITSSSYKSEYEFIDTHDDKEYSVLYKLISDKPESTDIIKAEATFANGKTKDDIVFKTKQGGKVDTEWSGNTATLTLKKQFDFGKDEIIATVKPKEEDGKYEVAGKLNTWHVKQREINLTLVSVNNTPLTGVKERINAIYNRAGVNFNISEKSVTIGLDKLSVGDSDMLSNYTDDEKSVIQSFKDQNGTEKEQYYMFFFNDIELSKDLDGFMPLKRQFGFVFKKQDAGKIAAHELGHGIFGLKHPWDHYNDEGSKRKTDYLMDYGGGTKFSHMDWQKLHAPGIQIYWFQGDEAGEQATVSNMEYLNSFKNDDGTFTFVSMSGSPLTLPSNTSSVTFSTGDDVNLQNCADHFRIIPFGTIKSFIIDKQKYVFCASCNTDNFAGYFKIGTGCKSSERYIDKLSKDKYKNAIAGLPCVKDGSVVFRVIQIKDYFRTFDFTKITLENYDASGELKPYDHLLYFYNYVQDSEVVYVPATFDPAYDDDVIKFLSSEFCFCSENDFEATAYGFIYATQLQKNRELLGCFKSDVPLFFYDENIDAKKFHYAVVKEWEEKNVNGFVTLKKHLENFKSLKSTFENKPDRFALHDFLQYYVPENISKSNANSYSLRFGTTYWESGVVLDKIQNISDNQLLRQYDDVFCLWESISIEDRLYALEHIANTNRGNDRSEEILLHLIINSSDVQSVITALEKENYKLFWKVWNELDTVERGTLVTYLNSYLINDTVKNKGKSDYERYVRNCENAIGGECKLADYNILPIWRANALDVVDFAFDLGPGGLTYEFDYSLETSEDSGKIKVDASTNYIDFSRLEDYWSYFFTSGTELFNSSIAPFNTITLVVREDIKLNGEVILKKNQLATVPLIFLHWLDSSIDSEQNTIIIRMAADGLVVASIVATGGATTPLLALDLAVFGTDFVIQVVNETSENVDPEFKQTWDAIYNFYNIANIPRAVVATAQLGKSFITFVKNTNTAVKWNQLLVKPQYIDDYINQIKNNPSKIASEIQLLDDIILALQNTPRLSPTAYIPSSLYRNLIVARMRLANIQFAKAGLSMGVDASITTFSPYLKISTSSGNSSAIANIVYGGNNVSKLSLESIRWLPTNVSAQNISKVGLLENIKYKDPDGLVRTGQLEIVQDISKTGQFYLLEESFLTVLERTYPNIYKKVSSYKQDIQNKFISDFKSAKPEDLIKLEESEAQLVAIWNKINSFDSSRKNISLLSRLNNQYGNVILEVENINSAFLATTTKHLDLAGYNRYPKALKLVTTKTLDDGVTDIENLLFGTIQDNTPKFKDASIDRITLENAPYSDEILEGINRITKDGGSIELEHSATSELPYLDIGTKLEAGISVIDNFVVGANNHPFTRVTYVKGQGNSIFSSVYKIKEEEKLILINKVLKSDLSKNKINAIEDNLSSILRGSNLKTGQRTKLYALIERDGTVLNYLSKLNSNEVTFWSNKTRIRDVMDHLDDTVQKGDSFIKISTAEEVFQIYKSIFDNLNAVISEEAIITNMFNVFRANRQGGYNYKLIDELIESSYNKFLSRNTQTVITNNSQSFMIYIQEFIKNREDWVMFFNKTKTDFISNSLPSASSLNGAYLNRSDAIFESVNDTHFLDKHHQKYFQPLPQNIAHQTKAAVDMFPKEFPISEYVELREEAMSLLHDELINGTFSPIPTQGTTTFEHLGTSYTVRDSGNLTFTLSNGMKVKAGYRTDNDKLIFGQFYPIKGESPDGLPIIKPNYYQLEMIRIVRGYKR